MFSSKILFSALLTLCCHYALFGLGNSVDNYGVKKPPCKTDTTYQEEFRMRLEICRKQKTTHCASGTNLNCTMERQVFKAEASVNKELTECTIEGNTTEGRLIKFVVEAKRMGDNQAGSRSLGGGIVEKQRGRCKLGYVCNNGTLVSIKTSCYSYTYSLTERPKDSVRKNDNWVAPPNYTGPVEFVANIGISPTVFTLDVKSVRIEAVRMN